MAKTRSAIKALSIFYFVSDPESESEPEPIRSPESESESDSEQPHHDSAPLINTQTMGTLSKMLIDMRNIEIPYTSSHRSNHSV